MGHAQLTLQDQRKVLEALYEVSKDDPEQGASFEQINTHLGREPDDARLPDRISKLHSAEFIEAAGDRAWITQKGLAALGEGEPPPRQHLGGG